MAKRHVLFSMLTTGTALALAGGALAQGIEKVQIGDAPKIFPESITSTSDGTLYAGSTSLGAIFKAAPGAAKADVWIEKPADGPQAILGVFADESKGTLWACYSDFASFGGSGMPAVVRAYDTASGALKGAYDLPEGSFCNDIATTSDGTAYVADTSGARIMKLAPGAMALEEWLKDDALAGVDGLSFGPDGALYVNSVTVSKLFRIDMDDKAITELSVTPALEGPDGMRFGSDGLLYVAENKAGRVSALTIDGDNATAKPITEGLDMPTAVSQVGDTMWVLEAKLGKMGDDADPGPFFMYPVALGTK